MNKQDIRIKDYFPALSMHPDLIYFDSAATSQKPTIVIDAVNDYYKNYCANISRGSYRWATKATYKLETVRKKVAKFINAQSDSEIVFTSGTTEGSNIIALAWGLYNLHDGDEILLCLSDHQSTVLPWLNLQKTLSQFGIKISIIPFNLHPAGDYDLQDIAAKVNKKTRLIVLTHIHNVFGLEMEIKEIKNLLPKHVLIMLDAAQSIGHINIDVKELGIDFMVFSGHKMFADTGIGILWINTALHEQIKPMKVGGGSNLYVLQNLSFSERGSIQAFLESGTPHIPGIISLGKAIDFIEMLTIQFIEERILQLTQYLFQKLRLLDNVEFLPGVASSRCAVGYGIIAFRLKGISSSDVGFILDTNSIYVRTGTHCIAGKDTFEDSVRVSMHVYNTEEEIDRFIEVLKQISKEV